MKRVHDATNLPEAYILAGVLAERGIRVRILNTHAAGVIGDLPPEAGAPQLWVDHDGDAARAREVIDDFLRAAAGPPRRCGHCGEENPAAFETCWSCGGTLPP